ncbi:NHL repeat-containing protein [Aquirhabdus parva]|uniref:SMP-30/Gluconolactonase/LRE-like region domain-containing protein n=1 Tax=Aquirhabdus parva TaxID=2283318 RepID=A0A345P950_9GAMM|nr:hypothetical protein [Aquirhabdus parva]AXI03809.1 hypothetical protein HYN46_13780 [Aquirhabdus parva]
MNFQQKLIILTLSILITACGGSSDTASIAPSPVAPVPVTPAPVTPTPITPTILASGSHATLAANEQYLVPKGTSVTTPSGSIIFLYGSNSKPIVPLNSIINVPSSATGAATYTVSSGVVNVAPLNATSQFIAGSATSTGSLDGVGSAATFFIVGNGMAVDATGNIFITNQSKVRKITPEGVVTTLTDFKVTNIDLNPSITIDKSGNVFVSLQTQGFIIPGFGPLANLGGYFNSNNIFELTATGQSIAFKQWGVTPPSSSPPSLTTGGLALDSAGNFYIADTTHHRIVKFDPTGSMSVFAGSGTAGLADGAGVAAMFNSPSDVAIDGQNNLYVADSGNSALRKIKPDGTVSTITLPSDPSFGFSYKIAVDPAGNIFSIYVRLVGTSKSSGIYRLDTSGNITNFPISGITLGSTLTTDSKGALYYTSGGDVSSTEPIPAMILSGAGAQVLKMTLSN